MATKDAYLVRDGRGRMRTIQGFSARGVVKVYLATYPTARGETLEVKRRLDGPSSWQAFRVS